MSRTRSVSATSAMNRRCPPCDPARASEGSCDADPHQPAPPGRARPQSRRRSWKRYFRDRTRAVRIPRRLQELRLAISPANSTLTHTLSRSPKVVDIATYLGVTEEAVLEGLEGARAYRATSLSTPVGTATATELGDTLGADDHDYERVELPVALAPALATLPERERRILTLRFYGNLTQAQIRAGRRLLCETVEKCSAAASPR